MLKVLKGRCVVTQGCIIRFIISIVGQRLDQEDYFSQRYRNRRLLHGYLAVGWSS